MKKLILYGNGRRLVEVLINLKDIHRLLPEFVIIENKNYTRKNTNEIILFCKENNISYFKIKFTEKENLIKKLLKSKKFEFNLFLCGASRIFTPDFIKNFDNLFNCHGGILPFVKGSSVLNWALIDDHHNIGVSINKLDEKIDSGKIVKQELIKKKKITDIEYLHISANKIFSKFIKEIQTNNFRKKGIKLFNKNKNVYYWSRTEVDSLICWYNMNQRNLLNFIKSLYPLYPAAYSYINKSKVKFLDAELPKNKSRSSLGKIVKKYDNDWYLVGTSDFCLKVKLSSTTSDNTKVLLGKRFSL